MEERERRHLCSGDLTIVFQQLFLELRESEPVLWGAGAIIIETHLVQLNPQEKHRHWYQLPSGPGVNLELFEIKAQGCANGRVTGWEYRTMKAGPGGRRTTSAVTFLASYIKQCNLCEGEQGEGQMPCWARGARLPSATGSPRFCRPPRSGCP